MLGGSNTRNVQEIGQDRNMCVHALVVIYQSNIQIAWKACTITINVDVLIYGEG